MLKTVIPVVTNRPCTQYDQRLSKLKLMCFSLHTRSSDQRHNSTKLSIGAAGWSERLQQLKMQCQASRANTQVISARRPHQTDHTLCSSTGVIPLLVCLSAVKHRSKMASKRKSLQRAGAQDFHSLLAGSKNDEPWKNAKYVELAEYSPERLWHQ